MSAAMKVTYFLEVLSSWCHWAEPTWADLKNRYSGSIDFEWKIALMRPEDFPVSRAQCDWFYRRSGTIMKSPYMLNSGWLEESRAGRYEAPNLVAEAAKQLEGGTGDRVRLALSHAALREGVPIGDMEKAVAIAAAAAGASAKTLHGLAQSEEVRKRVDASTTEFFSHKLSQRPAFVIESAIGDKAVFSGLTQIESLVATIEAMRADLRGYAAASAHMGKPPAA